MSDNPEPEDDLAPYLERAQEEDHWGIPPAGLYGRLALLEAQKKRARQLKAEAQVEQEVVQSHPVLDI